MFVNCMWPSYRYTTDTGTSTPIITLRLQLFWIISPFWIRLVIRELYETVSDEKVYQTSNFGRNA